MSVIIDIDHETGDLTQYTSTATDGGDLSVAAGAALAGTSYGLSFLIDDTNTLYGLKTLGAPDTSGVVRWRFYLDPNSLTMADNDHFTVTELYNGTPATIARIVLGRTNALGYVINAGLVLDTAAYTSTIDYAITDVPHYIEAVLIRATTNISADGSLELWIDGVSKGTLIGRDNYDRFSNFSRIYMCAYQVDAGTSGTFYEDELIINNDGGLIGPVITSTVNLLAGKLDRRGKL